MASHMTNEANLFGISLLNTTDYNDTGTGNITLYIYGDGTLIQTKTIEYQNYSN